MDKLTNQEKKFVKEVVETGNKTQAVIKAYPTIKDEGYASVKGQRLIGKDRIQKAIKSIADSIPDSLLIEKHLELLNKEQVVTKNNMTTGEVDTIETGQIDAQAVAKGLEMAYKLKGSYAPDKQSVVIEDNQASEKVKELMNLLNEQKRKR